MNLYRLTDHQIARLIPNTGQTLAPTREPCVCRSTLDALDRNIGNSLVLVNNPCNGHSSGTNRKR
jgi:hypothetical protein